MTTHFGILNNQATNQFVQNLYKAGDDRYKPLSKAEERELIEKYKDDRETLNRELINHNILLVFSMCRKYAQTAADFDDLLMNGIYGLSLAAKKFDIEAGTKFCTYASWWIRKYILAPFYDKYATKIKNFSIELDSPVLSGDRKNGTNSSASFINLIDGRMCPAYEKPIQDIDNDIQNFDYKTLVDSLTADVMASNELSANDKQVYVHCFLENQSIKDVSEQLHLENKIVYKSKKKVHNVVKNILKYQYNITSFSDI